MKGSETVQGPEVLELLAKGPWNGWDQSGRSVQNRRATGEPGHQQVLEEGQEEAEGTGLIPTELCRALESPAGQTISVFGQEVTAA